MSIQWVGHTWLHRDVKAFCLATERGLVWTRFTQMNGPGFMGRTSQLEGLECVCVCATEKSN